MKQIPVAVGVRDHFSHLLQRPGRARMRGDIHVHQSAVAVLDDDEHVEQSKRRGDGHEEVARQNRLRVVLQECRAAFIAARLTGRSLRQVLADRPRRDPHTQLE
ncbi:hypothetical protein WKW80_28695 [Variovorax humicola]|uniref:Uncharacterized protein n=1 Tax=Variovorax humicola TaxID=1769758 RepID=A0ABU8W7E5_9BURK